MLKSRSFSSTIDAALYTVRKVMQICFELMGISAPRDDVKNKVNIMDNAYSIRLSCEDDFDAIEEIERNQVYSNPWPPESFPVCFFLGLLLCFMAREVIGYIFYCGVKEEMVIVNFAVKPDFQGKRS